MNVLLKDGKAVGKLDEDGTVWAAAADDAGHAARAGRVDTDGTVFALEEEACLGSVDSAGLIWDRDGRIAGTLDVTSSAVYQDGQLVGHVFGPDPCRAAAALLFLAPDFAGESGDDCEEATQVRDCIVRDSPPPPLAIAPPARSSSSRGLYFAAHLALAAAVVGGLGWGGVTLFAVASRAMREARIEATPPPLPPVQSVAAQTAPANNAAAANNVAPAQPPLVADEEVRALLEERYRMMDAGYRTRDESTFAYFAPEWKYVSRNGSASDLPEARRYFTMRSSGPRRFIDCSMEQRIDELSIKAGTAVVVVDQKVYTETRQKDGSSRRVQTMVRQKDTWRDDGGAFGWRCVRSLLISQKSTRL